MRAYVVVAKWPTSFLTEVGKWGKFCKIGDGYNHIGLLFEDITDVQKAMFAAPASEERENDPLWQRDAAPNEEVNSVTWDYQISKYPRFQRNTSNYYASATSVDLLELQLTPAELDKLFDNCAQITSANPRNWDIYRLDGLFEILPWRCGYFHCNRDGPNPATCGGSVMTALAMVQNVEAYSSDRLVFEIMEIPYGGCCGKRYLTQLIPDEALNAIMSSKFTKERPSLVDGRNRTGPEAQKQPSGTPNLGTLTF